jgi:hypothetical protein
MGERRTRIVEGKVEETILELYRNKRRLPKWGIANWFGFYGHFFITAEVKFYTGKNVVYIVYKNT